MLNSSRESLSLQAAPILCLQHGRCCLYGELIQVIQERNLYWVRPIALRLEGVNVSDVNVWGVDDFYLAHAQGDRHGSTEADSCLLLDLHTSPDLIWPCQFFRPALDVEVLPLLDELAQLESTPERLKWGRHQLHLLIRHIWQAFPEAFPEADDTRGSNPT